MQLVIMATTIVLIFFGMFYGMVKQTEYNNQQAIEMAKLGFQQCESTYNRVLWKKECNASAE